MGTTEVLEVPRAAHWALWLFGGVVSGLVLGFVVGLTRPRPRVV